MSGLFVHAENRHWVFETLSRIMREGQPPARVILDLKGPTEGASIRWYPIECRHGYDHCPICDAPRPKPVAGPKQQGERP